jgi:D-alanyl-D-alanine carboxypeptidase
LRLSSGIIAACFCLAGLRTEAATAPAYIVVDVNAAAVIAHSNADKLWYPASVTKLMTAYLTFEALKAGRLKLTSPVKVTANALAEPPSKMGFRVGTVMTVDNALKMMIVRAANDIAVAIAETVGGTEAKFVAMMNAEAGRLGMNSTRFTNPNGLPDDRMHTTARDLAVLARAVWMEFPEYRALFKIPAIRSGKRILRSQNKLLEHYRGANGMKTGFICASGFNMVATATRNGRTLLAVVLGADSSNERAETAAKLLNQGFGGWPSLNRQSLSGFASSQARGVPVNLRQAVCGKRPARGEDDELVLAGAASHSALGPRFATMDPVTVVTGGADPAGTVKAVPAGASSRPVVNVPKPRLRPRYPAAVDAVDAAVDAADAVAATDKVDPDRFSNADPFVPPTLQ